MFVDLSRAPGILFCCRAVKCPARMASTEAPAALSGSQHLAPPPRATQMPMLVCLFLHIAYDRFAIMVYIQTQILVSRLKSTG
jgi:hypothetical protein